VLAGARLALNVDWTGLPPCISKTMGKDPLLFNFGVVLLFFVVGVLFIYVSLAIGWLLRPHKYERDKMRIYECGEPTIGSSWIRYNIRFYMIALVFLIFDVETAFLFPAAVAVKWFAANGMGWIALAEILVFVLVLALGLAYAWRYGNLDWVMPSGQEKRMLRSKPEPQPFAAAHSAIAAEAQTATAAKSIPPHSVPPSERL
jgi:NADH-quinone oxidoreductase subunit A